MEQVGNWRKASYSASTGQPGCVEVGSTRDGMTVLVQDTTNREGYTMPVDPAAWRQFAASVKGGNLPL